MANIYCMIKKQTRSFTVSLFALTALSALAACSEKQPTTQKQERATIAAPQEPPMAAPNSTMMEKTDLTLDLNKLARSYVLLALAFSQYDENYVDAYTGPEAWRTEALAGDKSREDLFAEATKLAAEFTMVIPSPGDEKRLDQMQAVMRALIARMRMGRGEKLTFDEETAIIYDAVAPAYDITKFDAALIALEAVLPGEGTLAARDQAFRRKLVVPADKIAPVMKAAIAACRARTVAHYDLPEKENFDLEFVNDKPWSAYNYYQGDYKSLIQVNLDAPFAVTRALDLGCHEGYPGHHVWSIFTERDFLIKNGWIEYYVLPLFSPSAFFAEGSANYGVRIAFPDNEKTTFERETLYPIAGIDPALAETWSRISKAKRQLSHVSNHVAREYLDGRLSKSEAVKMLMKYRLYNEERALQSIDFIETYRGYIINYTLGYEMVKNYIEANASTPEERWDVFEEMLRTPIRASDIALK